MVRNLWMTVGLPRSGKTTASRGLGMPIVNPDSIRIALHGERFIGVAEPMVWTIAKYMVVALFEAGHTDVVLDATNTTVARRSEWVDKRWVRNLIIQQTTKEECLRRCEVLNDDYIVPIVEKMAEQYEPPTREELKSWEKETAKW